MEITTGQIAALVGGRVIGDPNQPIGGVNDLANARPGDITFVQSARYVEAATASKATACFAPEGLELPGKTLVVVPNPKYSFILALSRFLPAPPRPTGISEKAAIDPSAQIGQEVFVGPGAVIDAGAVLGDGVRVGAGTVVGRGCHLDQGVVLHPNVTLYDGCRIGQRSIVHAGSVLGADGFGYVQEGKPGGGDDGDAIERYVQIDEPHKKVPQLGVVVVEADVEIGACVTVDRATLGETVVGEGTKIDNQVQIGHNVRLGRHVIIVAEVGIGGSVRVGDHVTIGGNCGIAEGAQIGAYAIVGAHTLMYPGKKFPDRSVIFGNPARLAHKTREQMTAISGLPRWVRRLKKLEARLAALEQTRSGEGGSI